MENKLAVGESDGAAINRAAWSARFVEEAALHPTVVRMYACAPYLPELYRRDLQGRITHPANAPRREFARPLVLPLHGHNYYIPGSADDLLLYTSCVAACCEALVLAWRPDADDFDMGPPLASELSDGSFGRHRTMQAYWARMRRRETRFLSEGFSHVVYADIARCIENVDPQRLTDLLTDAGANPDATGLLRKMHYSWQRAGCHGIPLTAGFKVFIKLYLKAVDERLRSEGVTFLRLQDDFRILCRGEQDVRRSHAVLVDALSTSGLKLNERKTRVLRSDELPRSWRRLQLECRRALQHGIIVPALSDALCIPMFRPLSLRLLRLCSKPCQSPAGNMAAKEA